MRRLDRVMVVFAILTFVALPLPVGPGPEWAGWFDNPDMLYAILMSLGVGLWWLITGRRTYASAVILLMILFVGAYGPLRAVAAYGPFGLEAYGAWLFVFALGFLAWRTMEAFAWLHARARRWQWFAGLMVPILFGLWLLFLWQVLVQGFGVPQVLLPAPSQILKVMFQSTGTIGADFHQTFIKSVIPGYLMGCGAGLLVAVLVDRSPFLQRGLLPLGNLVSALPIVGVAPIMVMWFGFDWQSKAAVVVIMTFFPMLVNAIAGLRASGAMERDLMRSYGADYWQTLLRLRLPNALPFIFNALKINSTLALIGAIVAEFFGTPIVGMGFRISTEIGRMNVDLVWGTIVIAALAGSLFYGMLALLERTLTFWHPSYRHN